MIQQIGMSENMIDIRGTFTAWFDITLRMLQKRIVTVGIKDWTKIRPSLRGQLSLFDSLRYQIESGSELVQRGIMQYNIGGKFTDMGVGRNFYTGNPGKVDKVRVQRERHEWQSRLFYAQVMTLGEIMRKKIGEGATNQIVASIDAVKDLKTAAYK